MKKIILTMLIILITSTNINAQTNNSLKFIGYSNKYKSTILEDVDGVALVINDIYNIYELFIPILEDYSIILNTKRGKYSSFICSHVDSFTPENSAVITFSSFHSYK